MKKILLIFGILFALSSQAQKIAFVNTDKILEKNGNKVSCKSIMGLMTIEGFPGSWVTITAKGSDAEDALDSLEALFVAKFNEV